MVRTSLFAALAAAAVVGATNVDGPIDVLEARQDARIATPPSGPPKGKGPGKGKGPKGPPGYPGGPPKGPPKRPVNSKALQLAIRESELAKKARELERAAYSTPQRNRVFSSEGHTNTLDMITGYLDTVDDYYTYEVQEFQALYSQASGNLTVEGTAYEPTIYQYSTSGEITAPIVVVNNLGCEAGDYPAEVSGNIALISRGTCPFGDKSALANQAGAAAAIIYNNIAGPVSGGTLGPTNPNGLYVPTVGISQDEGLALVQLATAGEPIGELQVDSVIENRTTYNIIAQTTGGDQNNVLAVGAHSDSVFAGPGINDDGSGTIGILETALQLAKFKTHNAVRFCFWSAEEFGLLGSTYYTQTLSAEEAEKIKLYLNYDMIASPNYVIALYDGDGSAFNLTGPPGSAEAEQFLASYFADLNIPTTETDFDGRSDYGPFLDIGIPAGGIFTGAEELKTVEEAALFGGEAGVAYDVNYHQVGDNYDNLNFEAFTINSKAIAASVAHYSTSFKTLPPRDREYEIKARSAQHSHPHARSLRAKNIHAKHDCGAAPKETI
ncbi:unnamed protein product [Zymoseptoria tritici ST99CH_1A5]|uniref:Peptide hydrolase n=1 Tax=Zymoseptoria tritici ST99CH_1A5 TaxID=1276529 RepID=A0A1Y6L3B8_ZYMTR|nr:unnamed protein product [Zymoseptoria tritici ST99CH_1A5]